MAISRGICLSTLTLSLWGLASAQGTLGVHARATPADYATSQQGKIATYAASLLSAGEVKRIFAFDITKTYLVFEVACYPGQAGPVTIDPADLRVDVIWYLPRSGGGWHWVERALRVRRGDCERAEGRAPPRRASRKPTPISLC